MADQLSLAWRIAATGFSFALFGAGGLVLGLCVFPPLLLLPQARRVACARTVIRVAFRAYIALMQALGVLRYEFKGAEKLERGGLLILANHPTLLDTVFLMAFVKHADCVVKADLWRNPFTRGPVSAAGYIANRGGAELVDDCIASLRQGNNLIIFPEGTRTSADGIVLKRGAANIAIRGARDITPVLIRCEPPTLRKGEAWWRVPPRRANFTIAVQDDLPVAHFTGEGADVLAARKLTEYLQHYFTGKSQQHA